MPPKGEQLFGKHLPPKVTWVPNRHLASWREPEQKTQRLEGIHCFSVQPYALAQHRSQPGPPSPNVTVVSTAVVTGVRQAGQVGHGAPVLIYVVHPSTLVMVIFVGLGFGATAEEVGTGLQIGGRVHAR